MNTPASIDHSLFQWLFGLALAGLAALLGALYRTHLKDVERVEGEVEKRVRRDVFDATMKAQGERSERIEATLERVEEKLDKALGGRRST